MDDIKKGGIVIIDFGSQYTKLIARRIRENLVFSEILSPDSGMNIIMKNSPAAIILSGGPRSVNDKSSPSIDETLFQADIPILGICYGLQLLVKEYGGRIESEGNGEYGLSTIDIKNKSTLFSGLDNFSKVWMSHGDRALHVPVGWNLLADSSNGIIAAISNKEQNRFATQFHPEVSHTEKGNLIIHNFLFKIAQCQPNWTPENFISNQIKTIRKLVGSNQVLVGVSGGVDSSVVAAIVSKAVGDK